MNRDAMFELRVLTGTHTGARALVAQSEQVLGSDPECDLVLSDEGVLARHARLELRDDGASVLSWLDGDLAPLVIRPGQGAQLGPVTIAIDSTDAPWTQDVELVVTAPADDALPATGEATEAGPAPGDAGEPVPPEVDAQAAPAPSPASTLRSLAVQARSGLVPPAVIAALVLAAVAVAAGVGAILWWQADASPSATAGAPSAPATPTQTGLLTPLRATLSQMQLEDRVRVETSGDGVVHVHASLLTDTEAETLAEALTRMSPRPRLRLESEQDVIAAVQDSLGRHEGTAGTGLKAIYLGQGRFRVEGKVGSDEARSTLLAELGREFPLVRQFEPALMTPGDAGQAMLTDLKAQGIGEIEGQWQEGILQIKARLLPASVPRWEMALQQAAARHGVPFRAEIDTNGSQARSAASKALPFSVRSIVSGDPSYVNLADGRRLVVDGRVEGWRLVEIGARHIMFEDAGGRRVSMDR